MEAKPVQNGATQTKFRETESGRQKKPVLALPSVLQSIFLGYICQNERPANTKQAKREEWAGLPPQERAEAEGQYHHMGRLARYHNIMGMETIEMLDR